MSFNNSVAVFGLGYVGLPLALSYTLNNTKVYGIDILPKHIENLRNGFTNLNENYNKLSIKKILSDSLENNLLTLSTSPNTAMKNSTAFIVTVGIPSKKKGLDFTGIENVCNSISQGLKKGDTVIIRSTVVPGTTEERLLPILESTGLKAGHDFYLVYCPERISEGNAFDEIANVPIILSGINEQSIKKGQEIINIVSKENPIVVSNIKTAEASKVIENVQRDVNIAMVQQIASFCKKVDINVFELIKAANTHPRVQLLNPGPGVGGYCIPNALHYLYPKADEVNSNIELLALSRIINQRVPQNIVKEIVHELKAINKKPQKCKVAVLGLSMKDYCSDDRLSPVIDIVKIFMKNGIQVRVYDSCVSKSYFFKISSIEECLEDADCLLITALQQGIEYQNYTLFKKLMKPNPIIYDTRNIINNEDANLAGFKLLTI